MTLQQHNILALLECRSNLKPPEPLFTASRLQRSKIAAGMKLQKGFWGFRSEQFVHSGTIENIN